MLFGRDESPEFIWIGQLVKKWWTVSMEPLFKSFSSLTEAENAYGTNSGSVLSQKTNSKSTPSSKKTVILTPSISVDAACSGNPGVMEYQGVDTHTKEVLFHKKFQLGTNNIGEFLALVHGLAFLKKNGSDIPIYSDSVNALLWIKNKKCKTTLVKNNKTTELFETIARAEEWLKNNTWKNQLIKWETESWGEIPADFGRK